MLDKTINTTTKIFLEIPEGTLIDTSVTIAGANILLIDQGIKSVYYIGKAY